MVEKRGILNNEVHKITPKNENELGEILRLFSIGMTKKYIREKLNLSKSNFSNYLNKLESSNNIKRIGKYQVKVLSSSLIHPRVTKNSINKKLNKRGHAHNFKILFPQETDLREKPLIKDYLLKDLPERRKLHILPFKSLRLSHKGFTIWINKTSLTIYSNNSYYSQDALKSKFRALQDVDNVIQYLKDKFQFKGIYGLEIFREHYGLIFNKFAEWILSKGEKMEIKDKGNKSILWVDDSKEDDIGLKEFEGINPLDVNNADNYFESCEKTNWKVTPEFILNVMNGIQQNQLIFDKNMKSHLKILNRLGKAVENLTSAVKKQNIRENYKEEQKSLFEY
jgi:hypothetical protein